jgi:uncharacterized protein (TIGR02246 family)
VTAPGPITLEDRVAIDDLFAHYAWAVDTGDVEAFVALFTPDAVLLDPNGRFDEGNGGPTAFLELMRANPTFPGRQHWVGQLVLDGDTERCTARSFAIVPALHRTGATNVHLVAWYEDELRKVDGRWLFAQRTIRPWGGDVLAGFPA